MSNQSIVVFIFVILGLIIAAYLFIMGFMVFEKVVFGFINYLKGVLMNIFSGSPDKTSKKILCNQVLELEDNPIDLTPLKEDLIKSGNLKEDLTHNSDGSTESRITAVLPDDKENIRMDIKRCHGRLFESKNHGIIFDEFLNKGVEVVSTKYHEYLDDKGRESLKNQKKVETIEIDFSEENIYSQLINLKNLLVTDSKILPLEDEKTRSIYRCQAILLLAADYDAREVIDIYFRKLHNVFLRKDGTFYTKVADGKMGAQVIDSLIKAYPWQYLNLKEKDDVSQEHDKKESEERGGESKFADVSKLVEVVEKLTESVEKLLKSFE